LASGCTLERLKWQQALWQLFHRLALGRGRQGFDLLLTRIFSSLRV